MKCSGVSRPDCPNRRMGPFLESEKLQEWDVLTRLRCFPAALRQSLLLSNHQPVGADF
jgi:hypothetical protein